MQYLQQQTQAGVCTITLHRPDVFHALHIPLIQEITLAFTQARNDAEVRVIVLTATGDKAFCSGADLKAGLRLDDDFGDILRRYYNPMILAIRQCPKPVICRLNGIAAGAGCSLALACDLVVAAEYASMRELFVGIGLSIDAGSSFFLTRLVGYQTAFDWCTTGKLLDAATCLHHRLVHQVVPYEVLDQAVEQLTRYYVDAPTQAIGYIKESLNKSSALSLEDSLELEATLQSKAGKTADFIEGVQAFLGKRKPIFRGK